MIRAWLTRGVEVLAKTPIFALRKVRRDHPSDGRSADFFVVDSPDWVNVVALTPEQEIVLVRQYRHGTDSITLEIPGGCVDPGEDPAVAAARELREETGFEADAWVEIGTITANPAFMTNKCTTFVATGARPTGAIDPDEHEELEVVLRPIDTLDQMIRSGEIDHAIVLCGLLHYKLSGL